MRVVVDVGQLGAVHVHFQTAFHALEGADGPFHCQRIQPVGEGNGRSRHAVLGVHPAGSAHADVLQDAAGVLQVVVEVAAIVGVGVQRAEIGLGVGIMIG